MGSHALSLPTNTSFFEESPRHDLINRRKSTDDARGVAEGDLGCPSWQRQSRTMNWRAKN